MDGIDFLGVFPLGNPIPYTGRVEVVHAGNAPNVCTWYHGTWGDRVGSIARLGLLPSCWFGGNNCCVFGFDHIHFRQYDKYGDWVVELRSRVEIDTELKAWWIPPDHVLGAWHKGSFHPRDDLISLASRDISGRLGTFCCSDGLCAAQFGIWEEAVLHS